MKKKLGMPVRERQIFFEFVFLFIYKKAGPSRDALEIPAVVRNDEQAEELLVVQ